MKITLIIISILLGLFLIFVLIGLFAPKEFEGTITTELKSSPQQVWEYLTDIESLPERRKEVTKVEMTGTNEKGLRVWKEYTDMSGFIIFESIEEVQNKKLVLNMKESTFGMTGKWKYEIEENNGGSRITVSETSKIENLFVRTMLTLAGRNANLKKEIEILKQGLK